MTAARLVAFTVVGLALDHPGMENVGKMPARTDTGTRINGKTCILTFSQVVRDDNALESQKDKLSFAIKEAPRSSQGFNISEEVPEHKSVQLGLDLVVLILTE